MKIVERVPFFFLMNGPFKNDFIIFWRAFFVDMLQWYCLLYWSAFEYFFRKEKSICFLKPHTTMQASYGGLKHLPESFPDLLTIWGKWKLRQQPEYCKRTAGRSQKHTHRFGYLVGKKSYM